MKLSFLKNKRWPRIAPPMEHKSVGLDASDKLDEHLNQELLDAVADKNVARFRAALEALILNLFQNDEAPDAA